MTQGICFSPFCLKLTTVIQRYLSVAVCMGELSSWKTASLFGNIWTVGCTWLQSLAVIWPFRVITALAEYQDIAAHIITDSPPHFTAGTRHSGLQASLGIFQTYTQPDVGNNVKDDSLEICNMVILHISNHQTSRFHDHHTIFFFLQCCFQFSIVDAGFVKLLSDCFCGNSVFKMNIEFCCHLCCSSSMIFRHNPLQYMAIPFN